MISYTIESLENFGGHFGFLRKKEGKEMEEGTKRKERYRFIIHMIVCLE